MSSTTDTPSSPARWFFGICAALAVFALVGVYSSSMAYHTSGYDDDRAVDRLAKLAKLQAADQKTLTTAGWVDQDKGVVRIPIDEAMNEEIATLQARPVRMGDAIPGATTAANTIPATNTSPADSAAPTGSKASSGQADANASPTGPTSPPTSPSAPTTTTK